LFAAIGTTYGAGDGSTTFNLPNLKGRVAVGRDAAQTEFDALGETGGAKTHTLTTAEMPSHTHVQNSHNHTQNSHNHTQNSHNHSQDAHTHPNAGGGYAQVLNFTASGGNSAYMGQGAFGAAGATWAGSFTATNQATTATNQATTATNQATTATNQNTGDGGAHNNLQPYQVLNYIIKASAGTTAGDSELATRLGITEGEIDVLQGQTSTLTSGKANLTGGNTFTGNQVFDSGIVRIPNQPAFSAMRRSGTLGNVSSPTQIIFDSTHLNVGGHYNTSNGRFTAPVAGVYRFDTKVQKRFGGILQMYFYKNNALFDRFNYSDLSGDSPGPMGAINMSLAAGDYVGIFYSHTGGGDIYAAGEFFTVFTGHLIG
jgi:microcystin-dependent protein